MINFKSQQLNLCFLSLHDPYIKPYLCWWLTLQWSYHQGIAAPSSVNANTNSDFSFYCCCSEQWTRWLVKMSGTHLMPQPQQIVHATNETASLNAFNTRNDEFTGWVKYCFQLFIMWETAENPTLYLCKLPTKLIRKEELTIKWEPHNRTLYYFIFIAHCKKQFLQKDESDCRLISHIKEKAKTNCISPTPRTFSSHLLSSRRQCTCLSRIITQVRMRGIYFTVDNHMGLHTISR